jgi:hypothetical protein
MGDGGVVAYLQHLGVGPSGSPGSNCTGGTQGPELSNEFGGHYDVEA